MLGGVVAACVVIGGITAVLVVGSTPPRGSVLWSQKFTLHLYSQYGLDNPPGSASENCLDCVSVNLGDGGPASLSAANGFDEWSGKGVPTFADCVSTGVLHQVSLPNDELAIPHNPGSPVGTWFCVQTDDKNLVRMRYDGSNKAGTVFHFTGTEWATN